LSELELREVLRTHFQKGQQIGNSTGSYKLLACSKIVSCFAIDQKALNFLMELMKNHSWFLLLLSLGGGIVSRALAMSSWTVVYFESGQGSVNPASWKRQRNLEISFLVPPSLNLESV
jgi:hypothetical protein